MVGDYISREAALAFPFANGQYDHENADPHFINGCESYREWLETLPAADVVEVVRCRECKYREEDDFCTGRGWPDQLVADDGFCEKGKRKNGGQDNG